MSRSCFLCCLNKGPKGSKNADMVTSRGDGVDTVELITGMNISERKLIKETAEIIFSKMHLENKGVIFLIAFFKKYPHHQRFFKAFRSIPPDELKSLPLLENHGRRVMDQMALLVQHLEEPSTIKEQLSDLVVKHRPRSVKPRQMKDMLSMFVDFTSHQLGSKFTPQHDAAWKKMTSYIMSVLEDASRQVNGPGMPIIDNGSVPNLEEKDDDVGDGYNAGNGDSVGGEDGTGEDGIGTGEDGIGTGKEGTDGDRGMTDDEIDITVEGSEGTGSGSAIAAYEQNSVPLDS